MNSLYTPGFRHFFRPVQPGARIQTGVGYRELFPEDRLKPYIYCYWQLKSEHKLLAPFSYRVIPDGCMDIFFDVNNSSDSRIMGFTTTHTEFGLDTSFHFAGVRFLPGALPFIFGLSASLFTNRDEKLEDVIPSTAKELAGLVEGISDADHLRKKLDQYFLKKLANVRNRIDTRLNNAIRIMLQDHGSLGVQSKIDTGLSPRHLRRLFEFYVGTSPKMFSKVVRFQYFLQLLASANYQQYNKVFLDAGYYDQPHFNRDFKTFFGLTPTEALQV